MPTPQPKIETVRKAYELYESGMENYAAIARIVGVERTTVREWLRNPARFHPYIDEIAVKRALEGERKVYENLTTFELAEFWKRNAHLTDNTEEVYRESEHGGSNHNPRKEYMAFCLGFTMGALEKANQRARQA